MTGHRCAGRDHLHQESCSGVSECSMKLYRNRTRDWHSLLAHVCEGIEVVREEAASRNAGAHPAEALLLLGVDSQNVPPLPGCVKLHGNPAQPTITWSLQQVTKPVWCLETVHWMMQTLYTDCIHRPWQENQQRRSLDGATNADDGIGRKSLILPLPHPWCPYPLDSTLPIPS